MRRPLSLVLLMAWAPLLSSCAEEDDTIDLWSLSGSGAAATSNRILGTETGVGALDVVGGTLVGHVGRVLVEDDVTLATGFGDGDSRYLELLVETPEHAVMAIIQIEGWFEGWIGGLIPGETYHFERFNWDHGVFVSIIGCSGRTAYEWDYDEPARAVTLSVAHSAHEPEAIELTFSASFGPAFHTGETFDVQTSSTLSGTATLVLAD